MKNKSLFGIFAICVIYLLASFLNQPLCYVLNLSVLPLSLLSLLFGILFFNLISLSSGFLKGRDFIKKNVLQIAIVLLGLKISLSQLANVSLKSLSIIVTSIIFIYLTYLVIVRIWPTQKEISKLIGIGTAICGVTAIIASSTVIKSKDNDIGTSVLVIILWGTLAVLFYPIFIEWYFITDIAKGVFLGIGIHDTSQVLAAAVVHNDLYQNDKVIEIATITKLLRNLFLAFLIPTLVILKNRQQQMRLKKSSIYENIRNSIPIFVVGFIVFVILRSIIDLYYIESEVWLQSQIILGKVINILFGLTLTAIGASIDLKKIFNQGYIPVLIGMTFSSITFVILLFLILILGLNV